MALVNLVVMLALLSTVGALFFGVTSMARGGDYDAEHSEQFMWERVGFQAIAVVLIVTALLLINS